MLHHAPIILASGSSIRQQMLKAVGLRFSVAPSGVEEDAIKQQMKAAPIPELALALARAKALAVSSATSPLPMGEVEISPLIPPAGGGDKGGISGEGPLPYVIGADQICVHQGEMLSKPGSYDRAEAQLARLAGHTHQQHCAVVLTRGAEVLWEHHAVATLTMRALTADEIRAYVAADAPLASCGAYKFEGIGRHLFAQVEGDHDVIQGLALVPLLAELHRHGVVGLG